MENLLRYLHKRSPSFWIIVGFILAVEIGYLDFMTGYELSLSLFYLLPIAFVTWIVGRKSGVAISIVCALMWFTADIKSGHHYSHSAIIYWDTSIRFGFFLIVTLLLSTLKRSYEHVKELTRTDNLTGAVTTSFFYQLLRMEIDRFQRNKRPFTVSYIDLDNFKAVNDNFGHNVGDDVLCAVVRQIKYLLRKTDFVARLGGDEFVLILPDTNQAGAQLLISKIQISLLQEMQRNKWPVTFSIGVLTCINMPQTVNELIKQADELMYSVKNNGKNSISYSNYQELKQN